MTRIKFTFPVLFILMLVLAACSGAADQAATETAESEAATEVARGLQQTAEARSGEETQAAEDAAADAAAAAEMETQTAIEEATAEAEAAAAAAEKAKNDAATQQVEDVLASINDVLQTVGHSTNTGSLAWTQSGTVVLSLPAGPLSKYDPIDGTKSYTNFVLYYDVAWDTSGWAGCSVIFRSEDDLDDGQQYVFNTLRFSGFPGWDVELFEFGRWQSTATGNIKFSAKMDLDNGATNNYILVAEGSLLTVYVNGSRASSVTVFTRSEGRFAFYAWQQDGSTTCTYENAWIWELP